MDYLLNEKEQKPAVAAKLEEKVSRHDDIRQEFEEWLATRTYRENSPLVIEGYTARDIFQLAPTLDGIGVYNFLVTLRDNPEWAHEHIAGGFKHK
jgi:hypothetical protein